MNTHLKYALLIGLSTGFATIVCSQPETLDSALFAVGKPLPVKKLTPVFDFTEKEMVFQGKRKKGLILDFWAQGCLSCVESFPETNALYKQYKDRVDFLLIGRENAKIKSIYAKYKRKLALDLPYAFDSGIFKTLGIWQVPRIVFINSDGIVGAIGTSLDLDSANLDAFINRKPIRIHFSEEEPAPFDYNKPLFVQGNGGGKDSDFLFRSLLTGYIPNVNPIGPPCIKQQYCRNQVMACNFPLGMLYDLAYGDTILHTPQAVDTSSFGKYWIRPVLELEDSSLFDYDFLQHKNLFSYNTTLPPAKAGSLLLQTCMQADLKHYFGYAVTVETRLMPCWKLVASVAARKRLVSKGGKPQFPEFIESAGFTMINTPVKTLISQIWPYHQLEPPILDETGISQNIDLTLDCLMTDWKDLIRELNQHGLNLMPSKAMVKVIVIRDPSPNSLASSE